jgi:hypothetical protein
MKPASVSLWLDDQGEGLLGSAGPARFVAAKSRFFRILTSLRLATCGGHVAPIGKMVADGTQNATLRCLSKTGNLIADSDRVPALRQHPQSEAVAAKSWYNNVDTDFAGISIK